MPHSDPLRLRVDAQTLEPDPALLARMVELSSAAPAPQPVRLQVLLAAASVAAIGVATWLTGVLPGAESPLAPASRSVPGSVLPTSQGPEARLDESPSVVTAPSALAAGTGGAPGSTPAAPPEGPATDSHSPQRRGFAPGRAKRGANRGERGTPPGLAKGVQGVAAGHEPKTRHGSGRGHAFGHRAHVPGSGRAGKGRGVGVVGRQR